MSAVGQFRPGGDHDGNERELYLRDSEGATPRPSDPGPDQVAADLTARYWDRVRFFAMRRVRDAALAEDVAQETLRRALEALRAGRVQSPEALPSFLFETARNVCMHVVRSAGRERKALHRFRSNPEEAHDQARNPLSLLVSAERTAAVGRALESLDPDERRLLEMTYRDELDSEAIGRQLGLTAGAVRVRRHRAIRRLAEVLGVTKSVDRELKD